MAKIDRIVALDIGASKLVVAEFIVGQAGVMELVNYGIGRLGVETEGQIDMSAYIVSTLRDVMRENGIRMAPLYMTVSGQAVFPRYVKLPPVSRDKILQIIQYEAEQNVPFPIDEVVWDYQLMEGDEEAGLSVMLAAVKIENVKSLTDCVLAAGMEPEIVDVAPMALYNIVRFNYPNIDGCIMVLDIGARSSNLIFIEENRIFSRSIPVAGNAITQDIIKEFDISFGEAEKIKLSHAFVAFGGVYAGPDSEAADKISRIVRNVITRLHAEVNRSINFYRSQQGGAAPSLVLLTGGSSSMSHMDTFFREKLRVQVEYLNPFVNVAVSPSIDNERIESDLHLLGEVAGLALRRGLACPVEMNLMPPDLVAKKLFRKRQPFFALASVGLALTLLCWFVYSWRMRVSTDKQFEGVESRAGELGSVSRRLTSQVEAKNTAQAKVDCLVSAIEYRSRWIQLLASIRSCLLDGMWLTSLRAEGTEEDPECVKYVFIDGVGFEDELKKVDRPEATAIEVFVERLKEMDLFSDETKIERQPPRKLHTREFTVKIALQDVLKGN